jgi:putative ABC transport system permease protein
VDTLRELLIVVRSLGRAWGFALAVIGTLALGIGSATAIYSVAAATLFPPARYHQPDRLVRVESVSKEYPYPLPTFLFRFTAYREQAASFAALAGSSSETLNLVLDGEPEGVSTARVSPNFFTVLGVTTAIGRTFRPDEATPGNERVAVLTHTLWTNRFGRDPQVVGRRVLLDENSYEVIGVLPREYIAPIFGQGGIYVPLVLPATVTPQDAFTSVGTYARLKPGVSAAQAQAELRTFRPEAGQPYEQVGGRYQPIVVPITSQPGYPQYARVRTMMWTALGAVGFLYAIACVNAGNLMVVRTLGRRRELCLRLALGGTRWSVARPLLMEGLVLAVAAIVGGLLVAKWLFPLLIWMSPGSDSNWMRGITLSWRTLGFLAGLGLFTGVMIAAASAWRASALNLNDVLKESSQSAGESPRLRALRSGLVVLEAALAVALLTGAGLMVRTFHQLQSVNLGYDPANKLVLNVRMPRSDPATPQLRLARLERLIEGLKQLPGVTGVGMADVVIPVSARARKVRVEGVAEEIEAEGSAVSPEFLATLGVPLRAGRGLETLRATDPPVVVINETMARTYFGGQLPFGRRLELSARQKWEIVGVVGDVRAPREEAKPRFYYPHWQTGGWAGTVLIRTAGAPGPNFASQLRRAVYEVDPRLAVTLTMPLEQRLRNELWFERFMLAVLQVLSGLALLLAGFGLFASMAYNVTQRRSEFGVRLALGATEPDLQRLVLGRGLALAAAGVVSGLGAAWMLTRFLEAVLYQTSRHDALTYGAVGLLMLAVAVPACWVPARRAARVDAAGLLRAG